MSSKTSLEIIHAYRRLHRTLLQAVQHARPARFVARDALRSAFRDPKAEFDKEGIKRTVWFLEAATKERGLEHRVLKNLIDVRGRRTGKAWKEVLVDSRTGGKKK